MEFRQFVAQCVRQGAASVVAEPVGHTEIPSRVAQAERGRNRALLFERVPDRAGSVVGNLFGAPRRICAGLRARSYPQLLQRLEDAIRRPAPLRTASDSSHARLQVREPDLETVLPVTRYCQGDAAPYLTSGIVVARYPDSRRRHVCFMRMAVRGGNTLVINPATPRITELVDHGIDRNGVVPVTILIGAPLEVILVACVSMPGGEDKLEVAQALGGAELGFSEDELPVPLSTEYVLRGRIIPQYEREGPFGEIGGVYSLKARNPLCVVDELWQRPGAVYHSVSSGVSREHLELLSLGPRSFLERLKRDFAQILRYELPLFGADRLAVLVVKERLDAGALVPRLWEIPIVRGFVLVNEDVASRSAADLLWAILQRAHNRERFRFLEQGQAGEQMERFLVDATVGDLAAWQNRRIEIFRAAP
ncbi:MAG: UbiD family decarboxylase [Burkholderiales bacterium]|nr:UbiD family decarboxylase [Burkholderiales bacterium]